MKQEDYICTTITNYIHFDVYKYLQVVDGCLKFISDHTEDEIMLLKVFFMRCIGSKLGPRIRSNSPVGMLAPNPNQQSTLCMEKVLMIF